MQIRPCRGNRYRLRRLGVVTALFAAATVQSVVTAAPAGAETAYLVPAADSFVSAGAATANFGSATSLPASSVVNRALLRFDTAAIPAGSVIRSVTLQLHPSRTMSRGGIEVHPVSGAWSEQDVTWSTQPSWAPDVLATSARPVAGRELLINLPVSVLSVGGSTSLGLGYSVTNVLSAVDSRESGFPPRLVIDYAPTPAGGAPAVNTGSATDVTSTSATLVGSADARGSDTSCRFDYGPTARYGSQTTASVVRAGGGQTTVSAPVTGLTPATTYHYRLGCTNASGTAYGTDATVVTSGAPASQGVTKILTIVEENHGYAEMRSQMSYLAKLSDQYGYATNYAAIRHPSLPNYLALAGGSTFGVTSDCTVLTCPVTGAPTVFDQAIAAGKTAKVYAEDMTSNCQTTGSGAGLYAVRHTAWPYFTDPVSRANCERYQVPAGTEQAGQFATDVRNGTLPTVGWLIPNLCNDAHNSGCTLSRADNWLQRFLETVFAGPDWKSGHLAVVVTADESDNSNNGVLTTVISPQLHGKEVSTPLSHYSLTKLQEQVAGVRPYLNQAASAPDMANAFGLVVGP